MVCNYRDDYACKFSKTCNEMKPQTSQFESLLMLTLHDDESNEFQIVMNATSMFVPGSVIDEDND